VGAGAETPATRKNSPATLVFSLATRISALATSILSVATWFFVGAHVELPEDIHVLGALRIYVYEKALLSDLSYMKRLQARLTICATLNHR
jgi:hypothetical protein